jgi:DNA-binding MarR family transcriptional regulator
LESTGFRISEDWLHISLTMPQVRLLLVLLSEERMRMSILASTLGSTFSAATGLVDRLVERELVERDTDPDDRRTVVCVLTSHGKELAEQLLRIRHLQWEERLRPLTVRELAQVTDAMELIVSASHRGPQL